MSEALKATARSFLVSAQTKEGFFFSEQNLLQWLDSKRKAHPFKVDEIPFAKLKKWFFNPQTGHLEHESGRFFSVKGLRITKNFRKKLQWDQPIIDQPEIGLLGILTTSFNGVRHFLLQAKMEPGNLGLVQLSPTLQATESNYTRVHQGKKPLYLEYFLTEKKDTILVDKLQSEYGSRFLKKRNRNMVVEVSNDIEVDKDFCWLTLGQIQGLLKHNNLVNMDTRSVISCIPFELMAQSIGKEPASFLLSEFEHKLHHSLRAFEAIHTLEEIDKWYLELKDSVHLKVEEVPLLSLIDWKCTEDSIVHRAQPRHYFSIKAISVEAHSREVGHWTQPVVETFSSGLLGFITQMQGGVLHFLVQARADPGNYHLLELVPTVACSNAEEKTRTDSPILFMDYFMHPSQDWIRHDSYQSEEGGRFLKTQNRHLILELPQSKRLSTPSEYIWMTLGQIKTLIQKNHFNSDARSLTACLGFV